jgi:hypothetical protein
LWLATLGCSAAGLVVALVVTRPLTLAVLVQGAVFALAFPLGYATVGLVLSLRRPANPIGWLYAASGLVWSLLIPLDPWVDQLIRSRRPLPLAAQLAAVAGEFYWAPAITLGITLPFLLLPEGRLRSRRWRVVVAAAVTGAVLITVAGALTPGRTAETPLPVTNPFGLPGVAGTVATLLTYLGVALNTISYPAALGGFKTKREAKAAEAEALRRIRDGAFVEPSRLTLGAYLTKMWLPSMSSQVRPTTLGGYRHNVRAYLVPRLGDIPLQRLTTVRVGAFYGELLASGGKAGRCRPRRSATSTRRSAGRFGTPWPTGSWSATWPPRPARPAPAGSRCTPGPPSRSEPSSRRSVRIGCIPPGCCWPRWECAGVSCWACAGRTWT